MKNLLLVVITFTTLSVRSQTSVYHPFPDSAGVWRQEGYTQGNCCCSGNFCLDEFDYNYFLNGDTLIGAFTYKKIYKTGNGVDYVNGPNTCPPSCSNYQFYYFNNIYSGCFRQDTTQRKVFIVPTGSALETLLYDFNLNLGDTLPPSWPDYDPLIYVTAVDSTLVGGSYHKRFHLSTSNLPGEVSLIEGIGNSLGFL